MADTETKPEVKTEEVKAEEKAEMKTEAATEVKKEDNGDVKTEAKAEESSEVKSEVNGSGDAAPSDLEKKIIKQVEVRLYCCVQTQTILQSNSPVEVSIFN